MPIQIKERFHVEAPPDAVWVFLKDPARVVRCLPGAELTETVDKRTYRGRTTVKVGPITTTYTGTVRLDAVDDAERRMRLEGEGAEAGGAGSARLTMSGHVTPADGGSEIQVDASIDIAGPVMQYGRGLVESVSRQLFKQFATAVRTQLEGEQKDGGRRTSDPAAGGAKGNGGGARSSDRVAAVDAGAPALRPATPPERALRLLPLLVSALADRLRRLFRRAPSTK